MPRRPATITQADVARSVRAAIQAGADSVEVRPDGTIVIRLQPGPDCASRTGRDATPAPIEPPREIVL